jgi:hypothetical protein
LGVGIPLLMLVIGVPICIYCFRKRQDKKALDKEVDIEKTAKKKKPSSMRAESYKV